MHVVFIINIYCLAMAPKLQVPDIAMQISDTSPWTIQGSYEVLEDVSVSEHESQLTIWVLQGIQLKT